MRKLFILFFAYAISFCAQAQYVESIVEYRPAPGQFINTSYGTPASAQNIVGGIGTPLTLGAYGGYVVVKMDKAIENDPNNPYGVDFTVFGNALTDWSEPGIVMVMQDENGNGLADDTWYTLAGSDSYWSDATENYYVSYQNPQAAQAAPVPWKDNFGSSGFVPTNSYHTQPYYPTADNFPDIPQDFYGFQGQRLSSQLDYSDTPYVHFYAKAFGYADNTRRLSPPYTTPNNPYTPQIEGCGGDPMDISWAVDDKGTAVRLSHIHFVKIYTAVNDADATVGEISTEICGIADVDPSPGWTGTTEMIVIKYIPPQIMLHSHYNLEAKHFSMGLAAADQGISFSSSNSAVLSINNNTLSAAGIGVATLTATLDANPSLSAHLEIRVVQNDGIDESQSIGLSCYPNPVQDILHISSSIAAEHIVLMSVLNMQGKTLWQQQQFSSSISLHHLPAGLYTLRLQTAHNIYFQKFIKR